MPEERPSSRLRAWKRGSNHLKTILEVSRITNRGILGSLFGCWSHNVMRVTAIDR